jgi:hypothetical protein
MRLLMFLHTGHWQVCLIFFNFGQEETVVGFRLVSYCFESIQLYILIMLYEI